jgi:hypothetical protein
MSAVADNAEWKLQNDKFRSPKSRNPDVYYIGTSTDRKYVILADGWEAPGKRRQKWVPTDKVKISEINEFGRAEAAELASTRGLVPADDNACRREGRASTAARRAKGDVILEVALQEIEADKSAGVNKRTGANTTAGCRLYRDYLPPERLQVSVNRIKPQELDRNVKQVLVEAQDLTVKTKEQYFSQGRAVTEILINVYGMDPGCKAALKTPRGMTGADADERPFRLPDIHTMENQIEGQKIVAVLGIWADTIQGAYYGGTNCAFQPVDLAFLKWTYMDKNLEFIDGRRFKTKIPYYIAISKRLRKWLLRRRAKGGVWAEGYVFPELVFGIRACLSSTGPLSVLTDKQEEDVETNVTERLRDYFNKFLDEVCEIKRPGITYKSFRHYILPYLRSQNVPAEVGKDIAGQVTLEAYVGYGGRGAPQQQMRATGLLEDHFQNVKEGKKETILLTNRDLAQYLEKVQLKTLKKLLQAYQAGTAQVVGRIDQMAIDQASRFEGIHSKLDALSAGMSALQVEVQELRKSKSERLIAIGAPILSFAPIRGLCSRECVPGADPENHRNDGSAKAEVQFYSI